MKKKADLLKIAFIICGLLIVAFSSYMIYTQVSDYGKSTHIYSNTVKQYVSMSKDKVKNNGDNSTDNVEAKNGWATLIDVDIEGLQDINEDVVGWIYFENLDISYPVLYSGDDSTYLRRSFTGENIQAGSIFMEGENSKDFSDAHTIIYGHNMKDRSMFGKLKNYASEENYIAEHEYFQIITRHEKYRYRILSYKIVADSSEIYTVYRANDNDFLDFAKKVILKGKNKGGSDIITADDHLITLSTCYGDNRFTVSAVRCDETTY